MKDILVNFETTHEIILILALHTRRMKVGNIKWLSKVTSSVELGLELVSLA